MYMIFAPKMYVFCYWRSVHDSVSSSPPFPRRGLIFSNIFMSMWVTIRSPVDVLMGAELGVLLHGTDVLQLIRQRIEVLLFI